MPKHSLVEGMLLGLETGELQSRQRVSQGKHDDLAMAAPLAMAGALANWGTSTRRLDSGWRDLRSGRLDWPAEASRKLG